MAESWPERRPGSLVQRRPGVAGAWFWSNLEVVLRPRRVFRRARIDPRSSARFFAINVGVVAAANVIGYSVAARRMWLDATLVLLVGIAGGLILLTWMETLGLRLMARAQSRRWRVTPDVAWTVAHHASVGWLLGGVLMLCVWVTDPAGRLLDVEWFNTMLYRRLGRTASDLYVPMRLVQVCVPPLLGLLAFETLAFIGVRRCRFANAPASSARRGPVSGDSSDRAAASA